MRGRLVWLVLIAAVAGLATGCATGPLAPVVAPVERTIAQGFELEGRLSASEGDRAASGQLLWTHSPGADQWTLVNPLGQIVAQLVGTPRGARLLTADGRRLEGTNAATMLPELLGVSAPFDGLPHWVQASPRAGATVLVRDGIGRPARIADDGWLIEYPEYASPAPDAPPRRIDAAWGEARIRLIIDQWTARP